MAEGQCEVLRVKQQAQKKTATVRSEEEVSFTKPLGLKSAGALSAAPAAGDWNELAKRFVDRHAEMLSDW